MLLRQRATPGEETQGVVLSSGAVLQRRVLRPSAEVRQRHLQVQGPEEEEVRQGLLHHPDRQRRAMLRRADLLSARKHLLRKRLLRSEKGQELLQTWKGHQVLPAGDGMLRQAML